MEKAVLKVNPKLKIQEDFSQYLAHLHPEYPAEAVKKLSDKFMGTYFCSDFKDTPIIDIEKFSDGQQFDDFMDLMFDANSMVYSK